jgi:hypothetical protein
MSANAMQPSSIDDEHLRLLAWGYVFSGVMTALFSLMGLVYALIGLAMSRFGSYMANNGTQPISLPTESMATVLGVFGVIFFLVVASLAVAKLVVASCLRRRKSRMLCLVVAGITCLGVPYGTLLGVCTFLVLGRDNVIEQFAHPKEI